MLFAATIVALYLLPLVAAGSTYLGEFPYVSMAPAALAGVTFIFALIARLKMPHPWLHQTAVALYTLALITIAILVVNNGLSLVFIGLIAVVALPAAYFQGLGIGLAVLFVDGIIGYDYYLNGLAHTSPISTLLVLNLPILLGAVLMYRSEASANSEATDEDLSYHQLATQLSEVSDKSDIIINAIADGVVALNGRGIIELINPAAQRILGWSRQDALNLNYKSVFKLIDAKNEEVDAMVDPIQRVMSSNMQESTSAFSLMTHSDKKILVALTVSPVGQAGSGVLVVFRDITNEKAEERQQAEFISTASHEMRTPVASIEGYLGLVLNPATATIDEKARDFVTKAQAAAQHLGRLFQDLLDVSRADDGRLNNSPRVVDVSPFVQEIFDGLAPKAQAKNLRYIFKPSLEDNATRDERDRLVARNLTPVFYANVDNDHLREIISNLIENAIKYTPAGEVVVDIDGTDDKIIISITDSGIGIPAEDQPHLFQKFYRVDNSETREIGGTGLGLYLCRRLAETMGGRVWAESEFRKGSTFHLEIPRISHTEATKLIEAATLRAEQAAETPAPSAPATAPAAPQPPAPPVNQAPQPAPAPQPPYAYQPSERPNTPLTNIESDPSRYMQHRGTSIDPQNRQQ